MSLTNLLVPTFIQMLNSLSSWLKKAQLQLPEENAEALLSARLATNMFPLSTQIRFACVQAHEAVFRLKGEPFPAYITELLDEGRIAGEQPGTLLEAQTRIQEAIATLEGLEAKALDMPVEKIIAHELPNGLIFDLTAEQYARDWSLAQFYFHIMTSYSILRSQKIDLGKADYVSHMFSYLRPPATPKNNI